MSTSVESFQLSVAAAEAYESKFVPAVFVEWTEHLLAAADLEPGGSVLDVACGTGIAARTVAAAVPRPSRVAGVDLNEGMLTVARRLGPGIEWHLGDVTDLPFPRATFDVVLCQAALMYFPDRVRALAEMKRVARPGGTVVVQVWDALDAQEGYRPFAEIVARHTGPDSRDLFASYFCLGDRRGLTALFERADLKIRRVCTHAGAARFPSIDAFVDAEIDSSPLADRVGRATRDRIVRESRQALGPFVANDGTAAIPLSGHVVTASPTR